MIRFRSLLFLRQGTAPQVTTLSAAPSAPAASPATRVMEISNAVCATRLNTQTYSTPVIPKSCLPYRSSTVTMAWSGGKPCRLASRDFLAMTLDSSPHREPNSFTKAWKQGRRVTRSCRNCFVAKIAGAQTSLNVSLKLTLWSILNGMNKNAVTFWTRAYLALTRVGMRYCPVFRVAIASYKRRPHGCSSRIHPCNAESSSEPGILLQNGTYLQLLLWTTIIVRTFIVRPRQPCSNHSRLYIMHSAYFMHCII